MTDEVKKIVAGLCTIAESCGVMHKALIKSGFTRSESVRLCQTYLETMLLMGKNDTDKS